MKWYLVFLLISLFFGLLSYLISTYWFMGVGVFLLFALAFYFLVIPLLLAHEEKERKRHECYQFVNSFIIALSVSQSPEKAFQAAKEGTVGEEKEVLEGIEELSINERLDYLRGYFLLRYYPMFLSIYSLFQEQGGDVLEVSEGLLKEVTREETSGDSLEKMRLKSLLQFSVLWVMSFLVMAFLRIGLASFYDQLKASLPYQITAFAYFLIAILSFCVYAFASSGEKLPERKKHGKTSKKPVAPKA
jgi:hypothetical protein